MRKRIGALVIAIACTGLLNGCAYLSRASETATGIQANRSSFATALSADGRWLAFMSLSDNLVPGDTNQYVDVFVRDNWSKALTRVSVTSTGAQGTGGFAVDAGVAISDNGRVVAFASSASDLAANDSNNDLDVFWHDRDTDHDGIYDEPGATATVLASATPSANAGNGESDAAALSGDGSVLAFQSAASDLLAAPDQDTNDQTDVFATTFDLTTSQRTGTRIVSRNPAQPLVEVAGWSTLPSVDATGHFIAFETIASELLPPGELNGSGDIVVNDGVQLHRGTGNVRGNRYSTRPALSRDGFRIAYWSAASNLVPGDTETNVEVFVTDYLGTGQTRLASQNGPSTYQNFAAGPTPAISADGSRVAYTTADPGLVAGDTNGTYDVFVHDFGSGITERASTDVLLRQTLDGSDSSSWTPQALSADGRFVALGSRELQTPDANGFEQDVFVRGAMVPVIEWVRAFDPETAATSPAILHPGVSYLRVHGGAFDLTRVGVSVGAGVTVTSVAIGYQDLIATVDVAADATPGSRDLVVNNKGTQGALAPGTFQACAACVTIVAN